MRLRARARAAACVRATRGARRRPGHCEKEPHHHRVVLAQREFLGHVLGVLARDVEEARARAAHQLDEDRLELSLGHRGSPPPAQPLPLLASSSIHELFKGS